MSETPSRMRAVLLLGRVSNLPTVWTNVLAAWFLAGAAGFDLAMAALLLGGSLMYLGGTTLNDFFDVSFDEVYRPERPIPSALISWETVGRLGFAYLAAGTILMLLGGATWYWVLALNGAILLYDWQHKRWVGSVFIMGACRWLLVVSVGSAVEESARVWIYGLSLMAYIVGLSYTARRESRDETQRSWPLILLAIPVPIACFLVPSWTLASPWILLPLLLYIGMVWRSLRYLRHTMDPARVGHCVALLLAGITLLDAMMCMSIHPWSWVAMAMFPIALLLQKFVPAT